MEQCVRILIADDQVPIRQGLRALLTTWPEIEVVGLAANGVEMVGLVETCQPDVALMDIAMFRPSPNGAEGMAGLEAIRLIRSRWPKVRMVVLTMYTAHSVAALAAGADAFLLKGCTAETLREALLQTGQAAPEPVRGLAKGSLPLPSLS
jgi:DNA-binding NarL/FixJ family response regulator